MKIVKLFALFALAKSAAVTFEGSGQENEGRVSATGSWLKLLLKI